MRSPLPTLALLCAMATAAPLAGAQDKAGPLSKEDEFSRGLSVYTPLIVKYRDDKTDSATRLEKAVR